MRISDWSSDVCSSDLEHLLDALDRIELVERWRELLARDDRPDLQELDQHAQEQGQRKQRQRQPHQGVERHVPDLAHADLERLADRRDAGVEQLLHLAVHEAHQQPATDQPAEHQHRAGQLLALGDVAFLARVLDLFRGRLFGLVGALILLCHAGLWLQAVWCNVCRGRLAWRSSTRSEEHTYELQSLMRISYAVFCLKKKKEHHKISTYLFSA